MWISDILLENIRGFVERHSIEFSKKINLIVGQNNSGKSTILNSILCLQQQVLGPHDVTLNKGQGKTIVRIRNPENYILGINAPSMQNGVDSVVFNFSKKNNSMSFATCRSANEEPQQSFTHVSSIEPNNVIYPYLSKRKVTSFNEDVRLQFSTAVTGDFHNLYAKIDRLSNPFFLPAHEEYKSACERILGFPISTTSSDNGKRAAYIVRNLEHIPLISMGEGITNLLGLIVDLCIAENKIFLIEEPENDIHPKALKALLELIERKSENNQFFISTHSNIVTKYLGSTDDSKVFKISMCFNQESRLPISKVEEVADDPNARLQLLEELGYEPFDFGQWKAWLILEESSAEVIIRNFLIPAFVPKLKTKLRTYSARSLGEVEPKFKDFNNLFVFIHLEEIYKNKAWVLVDGGENETEIIRGMQEMYSQRGWDKENFLQFTEHDFEKYYPDSFQEQVNEILAITNKKQKMERKRQLVEVVKQWIIDFPDEAKLEFAISAKEVIDILKTINNRIG